jgi:hypothetical protein
MTRTAWIACLLSLAATGCGAPWKIVKQADPNPLVNQRAFTMLAADYTRMLAAGGMSREPRPEADFVRGLKDDEKSDFEDNKRTFADVFASALANHSGGLQFQESADFTLKPIVTIFDGGVQAFIVTRASTVEMRLQILARDGSLVDEITVKSSTNPNLKERARSYARINNDAMQLGRLAGRYLIERTSPLPAK